MMLMSYVFLLAGWLYMAITSTADIEVVVVVVVVVVVNHEVQHFSK